MPQTNKRVLVYRQTSQSLYPQQDGSKEAGIGGNKTNYSLRATAATRLYQSGLDKQLVLMPRVNELLDLLGGVEYITTLDLCRGYWQVPMEDSSRPLTAFTTPYSIFQCGVMLNGAPARVQPKTDG